jgi:uncharacterized protein DUF6894
MPHLYFHLKMNDDYFPDQTGQQVSDLAAAHSRAVLLGRRVIQHCDLHDQALSVERLVVAIEDDTGRALMSVILRCYNHLLERRPNAAGGHCTL